MPVARLPQARVCGICSPPLRRLGLQVQAEYIAMVEKFGAEKRAMDSLLEEREAAYMDLLQVPINRPGAALTPNRASGNPMGAANRYLGRLWSGKPSG